MPPRIMYIEHKVNLTGGVAHIGRVTFSKSGRTMMYNGRSFSKCKNGFDGNCFDAETREEYWISGPNRDGSDTLYGGGIVQIDDDVRGEYWTTIRNRPAAKSKTSYQATVPKKHQN